MEPASFAGRLKSARAMAGLSLQGLADRIGNRVTRQSLHQYEQGGFLPDSQMLGLLCKALEVQPDFLFRNHEPDLQNLEFKKLKGFSGTDRRRLEEKTKDLISRYLELESLLNLESRFRFNVRKHPVKSVEEVEAFAEQMRAEMELGLDPISNVIALLEDHHIKVMAVHSRHPFGGLSAWASNHQVPVIVLNAATLPTIEEKRLTALHELGHLVLNLNGLSERDTEQYCHRFALALLLPRETLFRETGKRRQHVFIAELEELRKQYCIPLLSIADRMNDLGIISTSCYRNLISTLRGKNGGGVASASSSYPGREESGRFQQLLLRALAEEVITMSKAASLAGMKLAAFRKKFLVNGEWS